MKSYSVFVSSSDTYSDIWDLFFDMFVKYWPEFDGVIYLQTQEKEYYREDLDIICTKVGKIRPFGTTLRAGLNQVPTEHVLLFMIDYMLMDIVKDGPLDDYYQYFCKNQIDALYLEYQNLPMEKCKEDARFSKLTPSNHVFSYQVAFWKKDLLWEMALPHENPWSSEWYGNKRAIEAGLDIRDVNNIKYDVFKYNHAGCLHRGKWLADAVDFLNNIHYSVDFSKRGYYQNHYRSYKVKLSLKLLFIWHGIRGSYWHKIKRR